MSDNFEDLLADLDPKYANLGEGGPKGSFLKEEDLIEGFVGIYKGKEKKESQFGPTTYWYFETEAGEQVTLNRPHFREVEEEGNKIKKPTRFLVAFMNAKINEGEKVKIKQTGKGFKIEYVITKVE